MQRFFLFALFLFPSFVSAADIARLAPGTWDEFVPQGKEVDCIYGDYVLRNDRIIAVIANPVATRNANMTVRTVGGMILDLTKRDAPNDQLSCYYANGMALVFNKPETVRIQVDSQSINNGDEWKMSGSQVTWQASTNSASGLEVTTRYSLSNDQDWLVAETTLKNPKEQAITQEISDLIRADKTFEFGNDAATGLFWASDDFFKQAYGVLIDGRKLALTGSRRTTLQLSDSNKSDKVTVKPGESYTIARKIFPGSSLLEVRSIANRLCSLPGTPVAIRVADGNGPVVHAKVSVQVDETDYGSARTDKRGAIDAVLPQGKLQFAVEAVGRKPTTDSLSLGADAKTVDLKLDPCGYVSGSIRDDQGKPIPCKVAFVGQAGTADPDFGPNSTDTAVKNVYYSHNGTFRQEIGPGKYEAIVSYGPEYDAIFQELVVTAGQETRLEAMLRRSVKTPNWISADFHSHSTPSGDNTSSQLGRVQNLLCENVEFCPCTEHNRIDSYAPILKSLGVEQLMATCTGMELTGQVLPVNHQNAFPLIHKPRTQDGGGPVTDDNPVVQIERLALWDGNSDKLVQENHPNLVQILTDRDEDGKFDGGFAKMLDYMDVVEVHPLETIFGKPTRGADGKLSRSPVFHWMQMLNMGYRITGVVNTDAHYTFHDSGWLRNYLHSSTDDPAKVDTMDMVNTAERGNVTMTTGPFLEVSLRSKQDSKKPNGMPGDDVIAPNGAVELKVKVQCANWLDINRVQVFLNGRAEKSLNFTRRENPQRFGDDVIKFEANLPFEVKTDTHVIVAAIGEGLELGRVMGPERGKQVPVAVANPIFVDVDGNGFRANGDLLDLPLPKP